MQGSARSLIPLSRPLTCCSLPGPPGTRRWRHCSGGTRAAGEAPGTMLSGVDRGAGGGGALGLTVWGAHFLFTFS